jgi:hypothetical protein
MALDNCDTTILEDNSATNQVQWSRMVGFSNCIAFLILFPTGRGLDLPFIGKSGRLFTSELGAITWFRAMDLITSITTTAPILS